MGQRVKHLRYHEQDELVELKTQNEYKLKLHEDRHRIAEREVKADKDHMKKEIRMQEVQVEDYIRNLKMEQDAAIQALRLEFDAKARDLQSRSAQKMKLVREEMEKTRVEMVNQLDEATQGHIARVMTQNAKDFHDIKLYYGDITSSNLELIKRLKEEHAELKKRESADAKQMYDLQAKNRALAEPLRQATADVERLEEEALSYDDEKKKLAAVKSKIEQQESRMAEIDFQTEVLTQQYEKVAKERDELYDRFQGAVYTVQERVGLKNIVLEKKLETLGEQLEVTDAQVNELLVPTGVQSKMEEIVHSKNDVIAEMHSELQRIREATVQVARAYESKMAVYGVPVEELGFVPAN